MKAVVFKQIGTMPTINDFPGPGAATGDVIVDVVAAPVLAYHHEVFTGHRPMLFELPFIPGTGAIGRVRTIGAGATELTAGAWVYCDPTLRGRDAQGLPAIALQGLTANGPAALPVQRQYCNGSWAEQLRLPLENVVPLGDVNAEDATRWLMMGTMLVPYGGLESVGLKAGETVVINGASGSFGSAAVAVALAMGAARVVATGRNPAALEELLKLFGDRVRPVEMTGHEEADRDAIAGAAGQPIDVVLDILPPAATPAQVLAAVKAVRPGGRVSLMGGVGMAGNGELKLPYAWLMRNNITIRGQWLYPREAIARLIALARAGVLQLNHYQITEFKIADFASAIEHAKTYSSPFSTTMLRMS